MPGSLMTAAMTVNGVRGGRGRRAVPRAASKDFSFGYEVKTQKPPVEGKSVLDHATMEEHATLMSIV